MCAYTAHNMLIYYVRCYSIIIIYIYGVDVGMVIKVQRRRQVVSGGVGVSPTTPPPLPPRDDGSHNFPFYRYRRISLPFFFKYTYFFLLLLFIPSITNQKQSVYVRHTRLYHYYYCTILCRGICRMIFVLYYSHFLIEYRNIKNTDECCVIYVKVLQPVITSWTGCR